MAENYGARDIEVLKGLDAVRMRPGMYIGTTGVKGMHHILWEIVDNAMDEALNGYGNLIEIEIFPDNSISVTDHGRGVPVDIHPVEKIPAVELVFTTLHAGGKFNNKNYSVSGGLHGVGASVTNALSEWLTVDVFKSGTQHTIKFHSYELPNGDIASGRKLQDLTSKPCDPKLKGTKVTFKPDERVFGQEVFSFDTISKRIKELAFLNGGVKFSITDNRQFTESGKPKVKKYCYDGGISDFVLHLNEGKTALYSQPVYCEKKQGNFTVELAFQHTDTYTEGVFSYVNDIPTTEGGTHETGFKSALTRALNEFGREKNIIKEKQQNYNGEDYREGLTAVLAIKMQNVQFEGQTKTKLGNPEVKNLVENLLTDAIKDFLNKSKKDVIDAIFDKAKVAAKARESAAKAKSVARNLNSISTSDLIGKMANCTGRKPEFNELFIVEGDSAGGSAKQGRDRSCQAILPLRGKPLNVEKKKLELILQNEEIKLIINALGTGFGKDFNIDNLKYHKVIILADADQDGAHIRAILLTLFFRYMRPLITGGHLYIGMPPLYKVTEKNTVRYAYDDEELKTILADTGRNYTLQRYKGLGEMNPEQLWETTLDPKNRSLMKVSIDDSAEAERLIVTLMGEGAEMRREYIFEYANFNKEETFAESKIVQNIKTKKDSKV
ncbi:MAG: DNA gyrase subunit B [Clostridiales bacterium]|nr:DNA gyrase subunit B [Clostridiales bacterium]